jgi:hypothetical protein
MSIVACVEVSIFADWSAEYDQRQRPSFRMLRDNNRTRFDALLSGGKLGRVGSPWRPTLRTQNFMLNDNKAATVG